MFVCRLDEHGLWDYIPHYVSETENNLVFTNVISTSSGANPAPIDFSAMIFPKKISDSIYEKYYFLDKHNDYIIYLPSARADSIEILNIETKKSQMCMLNPRPVPFLKSPTFIITKTKVFNKKLEIEYIGLDKNDNEVTRKNTFKLKV